VRTAQLQQVWHPVFDALVGADLVTVLAVFKSLGVPRRLAVLLDGERLINDGSATLLIHY
jgi:CPA1 family monovalent cation:H+ antiporter